MSDIAISVENVSKLYHIGRKASGSLRETISGRVDRLFHRHSDKPDETEFWALKDVSFEIKKGDIVGIIGKNGAGKSTLLKVLSRITEPTSGKIQINGRVGSLLEVGTGFHPELSGRENIFLNGSILGMKRLEIQAKFDEIVNFSGIEKFIDTPVKRYSSGMYVRLAFAVAAHLEPEILIIDEVLAVGDAEFQKKCLGKMQDVAGHGRTVLFVSHNMAAIGQLCNKLILLKNGGIDYCGNVQDGIDRYYNYNSKLKSSFSFDSDPLSPVSLINISVASNVFFGESIFSFNSGISILIDYYVNSNHDNSQIVVHIWTISGVHVLSSSDLDLGNKKYRKQGKYRYQVNLPANLLAPGLYSCVVGCGIPNLQVFQEKHGPVFEVSAIGTEAAKWSNSRKDVITGIAPEWISELL